MEEIKKIIQIIVPFLFSGMISYLAVISKDKSISGIFLGFAIISVLSGCYAVVKDE